MGNSDPEPDPAIQARVQEILAEMAAGLRWQSPRPGDPRPAEPGDPEQHILDVLTDAERTLWHRLQPPDRARLTKEFRGGVTPNGLGYLQKKIALLSSMPAVEQEVAVAK